jgi:type I restriction enzyme S subunit
MFLPVPPYDEQLQIVQTIRENQTELQETCGVLADSLRLLAERRTALITAAVTGKIDVDAMN